MPDQRRKSHSNFHDEAIEIDLAKAVEAYDRFDSGDGQLGKSSQDKRKDHLFNKAIQNILLEMRVQFHPNERLVGSKQTISNWRRKGERQAIKKPRSVLLAVLSLTGIDISKRSLLAREPVHFSPLVELGALFAQKLTNDPNEIDEVTYNLTLSSALFKNTRTRVMTSWIKNTQSEDVEIGIVEYGLNEARVEIDSAGVDKIDWCRRVPNDQDIYLGRADGCVMIWSDQQSSWIIQPNGSGTLKARVENVQLATVRGKRGEYIAISIYVSRDCIEEEFRISESTTHSQNLTQDQRARARERLISLVIGHGHQANATLAMHRCKLP